jgi:hypothetical protein
VSHKGRRPAEALHVLAPHQRDVLAEPLPVDVDEHPAVLALLLGHAVEHLGGRRVLLAHALA